MKSLLTNIKKIIISSLILITLTAPVFSNNFVPEEEFNEVLNQLIVSNDMLLKVQETNKVLTSALEKKELDFSTLTQQKNKEIEELSLKNAALIDENNSLRTKNNELLAQLIISNDTIKDLLDVNKEMTLVNEEMKIRLLESNKLLTRSAKFSIGGDLTFINNSFGGGVSFSYIPIKNLSIDFGLLYTPPYNFVPRVGLSFLW